MRSKIVSYLFLLLSVSILTYSCQNRPREVLNRRKMEQVMFDVYLAEATMENDYQNFDTPEKKEVFISNVFEANNVTQMQWDTSLSWYSDRIDLYLKMNDSVKARIKRAQLDVDSRISEQHGKKVRTNEMVYSASYIPSVYQFKTPGVHNEGFRFRLDSFAIANNYGEDVSFSFNVIGVPVTANYDLFTLLTLVYSDTTIYRHNDIHGNHRYKIPASKYIDSDTLKQLYGFVKLHNKTRITPNIQLYNISLGDSANDVAREVLLDRPLSVSGTPQRADSIIMDWQ